MITYVNNVLVGTGKGVAASTAAATEGQFVVENLTDEKVRIGIKTEQGFKWAAPIQKGDVRSIVKSDYFESTEDEVKITLPEDAFAADEDDNCKFAGNRIVVRLTFKDLPTRFRKWTESYEYTVHADDTYVTAANRIAETIVTQSKRARVDVAGSWMEYKDGSWKSVENPGNIKIDGIEFHTAVAGEITLIAKEYTDDNSVDTINVANKIRFSATMWYTDPQAPGFASKNKYFIEGAKIEKTPGEEYTASWKLVRDMEAQAMGYEGILNRGECTWPIIKPGMTVVKGGKYDSLTIMFENNYRSADDLQRKTKQCINIYGFAEKGALPKKEIETLVEKIQTALGMTVAEIAKNTAVEAHDETGHKNTIE